MPPLYRILEIILYSLINFLTYLILAMYPFRYKLQFEAPVVFILIGLVTLVQISLGVWAGLFANSNVGLISAVSTLVYLAFSVVDSSHLLYHLVLPSLRKQTEQSGTCPATIKFHFSAFN